MEKGGVYIVQSKEFNDNMKVRRDKRSAPRLVIFGVTIPDLEHTLW